MSTSNAQNVGPIDAVVYAAGAGSFNLSSFDVARALTAGLPGCEVRSVTVIDADTGLTSAFRDDGVMRDIIDRT